VLGDVNGEAIALRQEAGTAGMKSGDILLVVDGQPVDGLIVY